MNPNQVEFLNIFGNSLKLRLFFLKSLPLAWMVGLKVPTLDVERCQTQINYGYWNKNPFGSIYFAVLAMAAELASGALVLLHTYKLKPSISMLVLQMNAQFTKKAVGTITFTCIDGLKIKDAIERTQTTGEGITIETTSIGLDEKGDKVAQFGIVWTLKARTK